MTKMTGQPEIKTEKEILESYDFDSDIIDQLDNFGNKLWVSAQSEIKFLESLDTNEMTIVEGLKINERIKQLSGDKSPEFNKLNKGEK